MCKTYTWGCFACKEVQDITIRCSLSPAGSCPVHAPVAVAGLPPDIQYSIVKCCYCGYPGMPVDVSISPTCNSECNTTDYVNSAPSARSPPAVTASATNPSPNHFDARAWDTPAGLHQGLQTPSQMPQPYNHVPHIPIDPALLNDAPGAETPAQPPLHGPSSGGGGGGGGSSTTPAPGEYHPACSVYSNAPPQLHSQHARHPQPSYLQPPPPVTTPFRLPPVPTISPLRLSPALAELHRQRAQVFDQAEQLREESRTSGRRAATPAAEQLDRAWEELRKTMVGDGGGGSTVDDGPRRGGSVQRRGGEPQRQEESQPDE
ncbi:hypothetical protein SLS56_000159 [Neofusicoccum ribis]|uniref:Uncharacterized protein n=1 Tax=Neofusicoccum ribis TaxID=45134 RepID=A0ABR3TG16_9PEZI